MDQPVLAKKEFVRQKLIDFQKTIADLSFTVLSLQNDRGKWEKGLFLEILEIVDAFENIFRNLEESEQGQDPSTQRLIKNFQSIYKKIGRLLEHQGVELIEFTDHKAVFGLCKVVDTRAEPTKPNETILAIVRQGYRKKSGEILRPAEVITVLNRE